MKFSILLASLSIFLTYDTYGQIWEPIRMTENGQNLVAIAFPDSMNGWMVGDKPGDVRGYIVRSNDGGDNWDEQISATTDPLRDVYFKDGMNGWVLGSTTIQKTIDGGETWTIIPLDSVSPEPNLIDFDFVDTYAFAVGDGGRFLKSIDEAETWIESEIPSKGAFYLAVDFFNAQTGFAVGGFGTNHFLTRTEDGGDTWEEIDVPLSKQGRLHDIQYVDASTIYVTGDFGKVLKSVNGGSSWDSMPRIEVASQTVENLALYFKDVNEGWIASRRPSSSVAFIHHTNDGGQTWTRQYQFIRSPIQFFNDILVDESGIGWACGHQEGADLNGEVIVKGVEDTLSSAYFHELLNGSIKTLRNDPNPFTQTTSIQLELNKALELRLLVSSPTGQTITSLHEGFLPEGNHTFEFKPSGLPPGIYFLTLSAYGESISRKMVLVN